MRNDSQKRIMKQNKKYNNYKKCSNKKSFHSHSGRGTGEKINPNQQKKINLFSFINAVISYKKRKSSKRNKR